MKASVAVNVEEVLIAERIQGDAKYSNQILICLML